MVRKWNIDPALLLSVILLSNPVVANEIETDGATGKVQSQQVSFARVVSPPGSNWLTDKFSAELRLRFEIDKKGDPEFDLRLSDIGVQGRSLCNYSGFATRAMRWESVGGVKELVVNFDEIRWDGAPSFGSWLARVQQSGGLLRVWAQTPRKLLSAKIKFHPFTPDRIPQISQLQLDPNEYVKRTSTVRAIFRSDAPVSKFECQLNGGKWNVCESPHSMADLNNGWHLMSVRAFSLKGRAGPHVSQWFYVYVAPPSVTIERVLPKENPTAETTKSIWFSKAWYGGPYAFTQCRLDDGKFKTCSSPVSYKGLASGDHVAEIRLVRPLWPWLPPSLQPFALIYAEPAVHRWTVQNQALDLAWVTTPDEMSNDDKFNFEFKTNRPAETRCAVDGGAFNACLSPWVVDGLTDGTHTVEVQAWEFGVARDTLNFSWVVDRTAPELAWSLLDPADALTAKNSISGQVQTNEPADLECQFDATILASCPNPFTLEPVADGHHTIIVRARDAAGNESKIAHSWEVDSQRPGLELSLADPLTSPASTNSAKFVFSSTETSSFHCSLDEHAPVVCNSPYRVTGLGEGEHSMTVFAMDMAGNFSERKAVRWVVDTLLPLLKVERMPSDSVTTSRSATFESTANEPVQLFCSLNGDGFQSCPATWVVNGLMDGEHTAQIQAVDAAGNVSETFTSAWQVAGTAIAFIDNFDPKVSPSKSRDARASFVGTATERFECKVDAGAWTTCTSPWSQAGFSDGAHTFEVRGLNYLGEIGPSVARSWIVDGSAPILTLSSFEPAASPTTSTSMRAVFSTNKLAQTFCRRDAGAWAPCVSPWEESALVDGAHSIEIYAEDALGNRSNSVLRAWTIDTVSPVLSWVDFFPATPVSAQRGFVATFGGNRTDLNFTCALDGVSAACVSPWSGTVSSDGVHTVTISASDALGRTAAPLTKSWGVDTVKPVATIDSATPSAAITSLTTMDIRFSASEGATFVCSLDGIAELACSSPVAFTALADGAHVFAVTATDLAGNVSTTVNHNWTIDTIGPTLRILSTSPAHSPTSQRDLTVTFDAGADAVSSRCAIDGGASTNCTSPWTVSDLADGSHTVTLVSTDAAGLDSAPVSYTWDVRTTALVIENVAVTLVSKDSAVLSWTTTLPATTQSEYGQGATFDFRTPLSTDKVTVHSVTLSGLASNMLYRARALATDADGRTATSVTVTFRTLR